MLLSYRWLSKILRNCPPPLELAEKLTMSGIEVETINDFGMISGKLVFARVESVEQHPEAAKLAVCQVDAGAYGKFQVVCGAPNVRPGMIGVLAREGANIAGGLTVKRTRIKSVASEGMLCSGAEIRWSSDHEGILEMPEDSPVGEPVDCVFNIKITPNRSDLLSVFGVARDMAALEGRELYATQTRLRESMDAISGSVQVTVKDKRACPRYACRLLRKCKVRKSPLWMQRALESMGLRSINNIVDVTNYVLLEYGHPLHAFDLDKIVNKHIIVRMALEGETLGLLDGRKIILTPEDLVIGDQDRVVALAGVMGGANSEISEATINVLIESAYFDPITIRRTSQRHGMVTDSSYRFERCADYRQPPLSLNRATQLMAELTDAEVLKGVIDTGTSSDQIEPITMNIPRACMILGCELSPRSMADRLVHLGFETVRSDREQLVVRRPSFRNDVTRDVDLIEEIARVHSYNAIPESTPYVPAAPFLEPQERRARKALRRLLQVAGFWEAINYSFVGRDLLEKCKAPLANLVELLKPLTMDQAIMRPSLLPSLIQNARSNQRYERLALRLFEIGKVYERIAGYTEKPQAPGAAPEIGDDEGPYHEETYLGMIMTGVLGADRWRYKTAEEMDFFHMKGVLETILKGLGMRNLTTVENASPWLHPGRAAELLDGGESVVVFGELHPEITRAMELRGRVMVAQARMATIERKTGFQKLLALLARFPKVDRDIALVVSGATPSASLEAAIRQKGGEWLEEVRLFDRYEGERLGADKVSLAYSMSFRASDRTLREEEVDEVVRAIVANLQSEFGALLRTE